MRIGVIGGTFDPIHLGHLIAAEEVRWSLELERVLFVPAGEPPHKAVGEVAPAVHRVRMVELAIASNPFFELSRVDLERPGRSYTVDTLGLLKKRFGSSAELFFIVGMDSLADLLTWRDPTRLISLCRLAVVNRMPHPPVDLASLEARLPGISQRVDLVKMPGIYISSTDLRTRLARGLPVKYQVPDPVEQYLRESGLYLGNPGT